MAFFLIVRRYAPFASFGFGFEGDTREVATTSPTATARTIGIVNFTPGGVIGLDSFSSGTHFVGAGPWLAAKIGQGNSRVKARITDENADPLGNRLRFTVATAGANPLTPGPLTPDIDTFVDLTVTFGGDYRYQGTVRGDDFPNAEVFVVEEQGKEVLLFDYRTGGGRNTGPARLFGDHAGQILGTFDVTSPRTGPSLPASPIRGT